MGGSEVERAWGNVLKGDPGSEGRWYGDDGPPGAPNLAGRVSGGNKGCVETGAAVSEGWFRIAGYGCVTPGGRCSTRAMKNVVVLARLIVIVNCSLLPAGK